MLKKIIYFIQIMLCVSINGVPIGRMSLRWARGEPDNFENSEECLVLKENGTMADVQCSLAYPYVCYKKKTGPIVLTECGTIDKAYKFDIRTGSCYKLHFVSRPWSRAFMTCAAEGAYLAIVNSETEAQVLKEIYASHPDSEITGDIKNVASIGFHDWGEQMVWTTIHGQSIHEAGYAVFGPGQPDNAPIGEHCGAIFRNGRLDDMWCERNTPFICEKKTDSLLNNDYDSRK